jgi:sec-independent protein translocase protein TatC
MSDDNLKPDDVSQPLVAHLTELRDRLLRGILAVLIIFLCLFSFANEIYTIASEPLRQFLPEGTSMIATEVASPFLTPFKLTLFVSIFLAIPFLLHQVWSFIAPGMYRHEKRLAIPILASSILLFYAGILFAYYVVFPLVFGFFTSVAPEGVTIMTDINSYLDFILKLFFAFGIAFEIPIATILIVATGMSTADSLAAKRPYVIIGCFVVGMLLTPPDIISQTLLAIPVWLLFEIGIIASRFITIKNIPDSETKNESGEAS